MNPRRMLTQHSLSLRAEPSSRWGLTKSSCRKLALSRWSSNGGPRFRGLLKRIYWKRKQKQGEGADEKKKSVPITRCGSRAMPFLTTAGTNAVWGMPPAARKKIKKPNITEKNWSLHKFTMLSKFPLNYGRSWINVQGLLSHYDVGFATAQRYDAQPNEYWQIETARRAWRTFKKGLLGPFQMSVKQHWRSPLLVHEAHWIRVLAEHWL